MLQTIKIILLFFMVCCVIWLLIKLFKSKQPKKIFLFSAISGLLTLGIMRVLGEFLAQTIHINIFTVGTATSLGIPGVILLLITKLLWCL